ncbi:signal peptidase I [Rhodospirillaceae bacterium SYSU D60014]|uniref:signal peptidase I n=1 Tax=Virgifigura deserti TaxID=2268457 RepID=UPI000E6728FC
MSKRKSGGVLDTIRTVIYAVLIAVVVRAFAYEPFNIPSGSMIPTLLVGDFLFVSKFSYGYSRYSLPFGLPLFEGRIFESPPERGDVAVFKLPTDGKTDYIKRIVGLPGDRIQVREGVLHINGEPVERTLIDDYMIDAGIGMIEMRETVDLYEETLPNGKSHYIIERSDHAALDDTPVFTVPPGHYFAMGDNRDNSQDSRTSMVGFIPAENLVGRAEFIFYSHSARDASPLEIWKWLPATRFDRLLDAIE